MKHNSFAADSRLIEALRERSQPVACTEGRILFSQGDAPGGLYIIKSGEAALVMTSATGNVIMCFHTGAGSLLGLPAVIGKEPYSLTAMARKGSVVSFVTRDDFEQLLRTDPSMNPYILKVLAKEIRTARNEISDWRGQSATHQFHTPLAR
jgi:CRP/FNR family transcriptional regulator, dissimilatory nitrate respiration regulator